LRFGSVKKHFWFFQAIENDRAGVVHGGAVTRRDKIFVYCTYNATGPGMNNDLFRGHQISSFFLIMTQHITTIQLYIYSSIGGVQSQGDFSNVENKRTQMYYYITVSFSCVFPIS
jgi:hypothetical protein